MGRPEGGGSGDGTPPDRRPRCRTTANTVTGTVRPSRRPVKCSVSTPSEGDEGGIAPKAGDLAGPPHGRLGPQPARSVTNKEINEMSISLDTMPAPVRDSFPAMNAFDSAGM